MTRPVAVEGTELFVAGPRQVVRVRIATPPATRGSVTVELRGRDVVADPVVVEIAEPGERTVEVPAVLPGPPGALVPVEARCAGPVGTGVVRGEVEVAEPGWTVHLVPHFHVDAVWWNTQGATISEWEHRTWSAAPQMPFQRSAFAVLDAHLDRADRDPDYRFAVAEVDYLQPYRQRFPWRRALLARLLAQGRVEVVGGSHNEPQTSLVALETTRRAIEQGLAHQRRVLGATVRTAWQLDVFGHAPQYPDLLADAGLDAAVFARGPFHQWGPLADGPFAEPAERGDVEFAADFDWVAPSGRSVRAHYLSAHYTAGHRLDACETVEEAFEAVHGYLRLLRRRAGGRSVLVPVGTDLAMPDRWVTEVPRRWPYLWPAVRCSTPSEALADGGVLRPQSREMGPVYTGKEVTHIGLKQADAECTALLRAAETAAAGHGAAPGWRERLDRADRLLVYGAHHDAVTGTCSDQVYLDLLAGWQEAHHLAGSVLAEALGRTAGGGTRIVVANPSAHDRSDVVRVEVARPGPGLRVLTADGTPVPAVVDREADGRVALTVLVPDVPGLGHRVLTVVPAADLPTWRASPGATIAVGELSVTAGSAGITSLRAGGRELLGAPAGPVLQEEYRTHPDFGEGPWHLMPTGTAEPAPVDAVRRWVSPVGERLELSGAAAGYTHRVRLDLRHGVPRVDVQVAVDDWTGVDRLLRMVWPLDVPGALPVADAGECVVGRPFGFPRSDAARHPWTLDGSSHTWFGLGATAGVRFADGDTRPIGVAELVAPPSAPVAGLVAALAACGVPTTVTAPDATRVGLLARDSSLPDVRIVVEAGDGVAWVPAPAPLRRGWLPGLDVTAGLPELRIGVRALAAVAAELRGSHRIRVSGVSTDPPWAGRTVAVAHRGTPGGVVDTAGALHVSLLRACPAWPAGGWVDPPRRGTPDGASFALQRWSHTLEHAVLAGPGDWRDAGIADRAEEVARPLRAVVVDRAVVDRAVVDTDGAPGGLRVRGARVSAVRPGPAGTVDVRLHSLATTETTADVTAPGLRAASTVDLAGRRAPLAVVDGGVAVPVPALGSVAVRLDVPAEGRAVRTDAGDPDGGDPDVGDPDGGDPDVGDPDVDLAPAFSRWWTRGSGPAPLGGLPVAVHLHATPDPTGGAVGYRVTVASDLDEPVAVRLCADDPAVVDRPDVLLEPGGWAVRDVRRVDPTPGRVLRVRAEGVRAEGVRAEGVRLRPAEDALVVGAPPEPRHGPVGSVEGPDPLDLAPGGTGVLRVTLRSRVLDPVRAEVVALTPFGAWELVAQPRTEVVLAPGAPLTVRIPVRAPLTHRRGRWWAMVLVRCLHQVVYSRSVRLTVRDPGPRPC